MAASVHVNSLGCRACFVQTIGMLATESRSKLRVRMSLEQKSHIGMRNEYQIARDDEALPVSEARFWSYELSERDDTLRLL
jgi:hypothetical protein